MLKYHQKQPSSGVLRKMFSENMRQIYRRTPMPKNVISINLQSNFIEITLQHGCSAVNLLHFLKASFAKNTSGWLLLYHQNDYMSIAFQTTLYTQDNKDSIIQQILVSREY